MLVIVVTTASPNPTAKTSMPCALRLCACWTAASSPPYSEWAVTWGGWRRGGGGVGLAEGEEEG